ncbi:twin-arginine translocase TatA/TatE family subunit [Rathayibacter caricis]|uniref:twin-arginine translocase TatA/TatE family subunit n=1 Tax=Rathayibacter caricis TaxID=110936 RepID=UPI0027E0F018|nr:twin-arginine translocase TatA/TatE family subunit [Rathayibacter caricis]
MTGWHGLIVLAVIILLFGSSKLPQLARGIGQSIRIFRAETRHENTFGNTSTTTPRPPRRAK